MSEVFVKPFAPASTQGQSGGDYATTLITATTSSARVAIQPSPEISGLPRGRTVSVANAGLVPVFVEFGDSSVAARLPVNGGQKGSKVVLPGTEVVFDGLQAVYIAVITASGSADVYVTPGEGV